MLTQINECQLNLSMEKFQWNFQENAFGSVICRKPAILFQSDQSQGVDPSGAEAGIFQVSWVNTMATDALAPCVARSSAVIVIRRLNARLQ